MVFFKLEFTPLKAEQLLEDMEIQKEWKDENHIGKVFRINPNIKVVY